jgi:uncharacterized protein (TIGR03067 family)
MDLFARFQSRFAKVVTLPALLLLSGLAQGQEASKPAKEKAATEFKAEGDWKASAATHAGIELGGPFLTNMTLKIKGDQFDLVAGPIKEKGKAEFTTDAKPVKMKITADDGNNKGKSLFAICEQIGPDQIKVCYSLKGKEYPKAFESTEENKALLVIYDRVK